MTFGEKLQKYIDDNGITKAELARRLGANRQTVGRYILGQTIPDYTVVLEYASKLGLSTVDLMDDRKMINGYVPQSGIVGLYNALPDEGKIELKKYGRYLLDKEMKEREL